MSLVTELVEKYVIRCITVYYKKESRVDEMAQRIKELASKPDNLSLIPETHRVKGEN